MGLTWDCLDFEYGTLLVKQQLRREQKKGGQYYFSLPKNNKSRVLALAPSVLRLFKLQKLKQNGMQRPGKAGRKTTWYSPTPQAAFTLDVYGHVTAQMRRESASRMEQFIQSVSA